MLGAFPSTTKRSLAANRSEDKSPDVISERGAHVSKMDDSISGEAAIRIVLILKLSFVLHQKTFFIQQVVE